MLVLERRAWWKMLVPVPGTALPQIWPRLGAVFLVSVAVTLGEHHLSETMLHLTPLPFTLVAVALGIFLGFRNNTAYDRFWEGRKLWGQLVNSSRNFSRLVHDLVGPREPGEDLAPIRRELVHGVIAYAHALRHHLRDENDRVSLEGLLPAEEIAELGAHVNRPFAIVQGLGRRLAAHWRAGRIDPLHLPMLEKVLDDFMDIQGGCERIKLTPIPSSYTILIHRIVAVYLFTLPLGIVDSVGVATPAVALLIAYAFFGLDALGEEIEDPFGTDPNDLPLSSIARTIEINLRQSLGETDVPPPLRPIDRVLS
jgi:ion channel-forming bestrophin family protein